MNRYCITLCCFYLIATSSWSQSHHPEVFLNAIVGSKTEGAQIVAHFCATCHAPVPLIALGAPRIRNRSDWGPRVKAGIDVLFQHVAEGFHAMPARGGCFECTDKQLMLAILALLPEDMLEKKKPSAMIK